MVFYFQLFMYGCIHSILFSPIIFFTFTQLFFRLSGQSMLNIELVKNLLIAGEFKL